MMTAFDNLRRLAIAHSASSLAVDNSGQFLFVRDTLREVWRIHLVDVGLETSIAQDSRLVHYNRTRNGLIVFSPTQITFHQIDNVASISVAKSYPIIYKAFDLDRTSLVGISHQDFVSLDVHLLDIETFAVRYSHRVPSPQCLQVAASRDELICINIESIDVYALQANRIDFNRKVLFDGWACDTSAASPSGGLDLTAVRYQSSVLSQ